MNYSSRSSPVRFNPSFRSFDLITVNHGMVQSYTAAMGRFGKAAAGADLILVSGDGTVSDNEHRARAWQLASWCILEYKEVSAEGQST
jgi:hypothetical protein